MKSITHFLAAAIAATVVFTSAPEAEAAKITLAGSGFYKISNKIRYYGEPGPKQSGRFGRLGEDYYHKAVYGFDLITNRSGTRSGDLSFEFWAMPYYGATSGYILMTRGKNRLGGGRSYVDPTPSGQAISLDLRRFPELNIWEFTRKGWVNRDAMTFKRSEWL